MSRALVFDLDDTLYPEHQFVLSGFRAVDSWLMQNRGISGFLPIAAQLFHAGHRGNIFDQALTELGTTTTPEHVKELVNVYREHKPRLSLHEDARWALDHFSAQAPLGLITDGYLITQKNKVEALGIAHYFAALVFSDEHGRDCWKPSAVPYQRCMGVLNSQGEDCIYVGDNPSKDFVTAKALGWKTIQISREGGEYAKLEPADSHRAHHHIQSLYELKDLLS